MAENKQEQMDEDYLDRLLNAVSPEDSDTVEENADDNYLSESVQTEENTNEDIDNSEENFFDDLAGDINFDEILNEEENADDIPDIDNTEESSKEADELEDLLSMINSSDESDEDIDKIAEEISDVPDIKELEIDKPKDKKKGLLSSIFKKKTKKKKQEENISANDNDKIIESVESDSDADLDFDLSQFDDLANIEDRSEGEHEPTEAEKKAAKAKKKKEKAEKKAEKKKKEAEKKKKKTDSKKEKAEKKASIPVERIKINPKVLILVVSIIVIVVLVLTFGAKEFWYKKQIKQATNLIIDKKYEEAYDNLSGMTVKKGDSGLYNQVRTLMIIEKQYSSYKMEIKINRPKEALNCLIKGIVNYNRNIENAKKYGVDDKANEILNRINAELKNVFNLSEEDAVNISKLEDVHKYSEKISEIVNSNYKDKSLIE